MNIKERNKQVKKILSGEFGFKNVSVRGETGTATGWCIVSIKMTDPCPYKQHKEVCTDYCNGTCAGNNRLIAGGWGNTVRQLKKSEIDTKVNELLKDVKFYTYTNDEDIDRKELFISIDTLKEERQPLEWDALWSVMGRRPTDWQPTTENMYYEMLGAVPPEAMKTNSFLVGEPHHHNEEGFPVYAAFRISGDKFEARYMTLREFKAPANIL